MSVYTSGPPLPRRGSLLRQQLSQSGAASGLVQVLQQKIDLFCLLLTPAAEMEELSHKMKVLELQDEKTILMKKEVDVEDQICDVQERLDTIMKEKSDLDKINKEIDEKIEHFNKEYEVFQGKQRDIKSKVLSPRIACL